MATSSQIERTVDCWHVPPVCQGQIVEVAYGSDCAGTLYRRTTDRSDRSVSYEHCDANDCGCADECDCWQPWNVEPSAYDWQAYGKSDVQRWETVDAYVQTYPSDGADGACDVDVQIGEAGGRWYLHTRDDAGGSDEADDTSYPSEASASAAAESLASDRTEGNEGEDADGYLRRMTEERSGEPDADGEWCVYWSTALDDSGPRERYATQEQAEAAAEIANKDLHQAHRGHLLCGYEVRQLVDGEWIALEAE